jgi:hypothetical protein
MTEKISSLHDKFKTIIKNIINELQEFDLKSKIEERKIVINELNSLIIRLKQSVF